MVLRRLAIIVACALGSLAPQPLAAARHAVVVGINDYKHPNLPKLTKAVPDAQRAARELTALGYTVDLVDGTKKPTTLAVIQAAWTEALAKLKRGDVILFYFAGHGLELEGQNFLLPSNIEFAWNDANLVKRSSLDLQQLIRELASKQRDTDAMGVFIIDACRENPGPWRGGSSLERGLAPIVDLPREVFVMYSAGIGQKADDGADKDANSPYATELFAHWNKGLALTDLAQTIRFSVNVASGYRQSPAYYDQLRRSRTLTGDNRQPATFASTAGSAKGAKPSGRLRALARDTLIDCERGCPEMVVVGAGEFQMGSPPGDAMASAHEWPPHPVKIGKMFALGKFEITNGEWNACVEANACAGARPLAGTASAALDPVVGVSWTDAQAYVAWLSGLTGKRYRLPSEAEWEYAARAGTATRYHFGDDPMKIGADAGRRPQTICAYANGADLSAGALFDGYACDDHVGRTVAPRGSYLPNAFGLFDMHGNAWEWVADCWHPSYQGAPGDGRAWDADGTAANCAARVARGGSWRSGLKGLRSAARNTFAPDHRRATLGFRVAREIEPGE